MTVLLPGQAAAPAGPADMRMMYVLHHAFRRDLARFHRACELTPDDDLNTWRALRRRWELFATLLHDHHTKEDEVLWPLLRMRAREAGDDAGLAVLDEMEAEHQQIDPLLERIEHGFVQQSTAPSDRVRGDLHRDLGAAAEVLGDHLGHEEADAIALIQRYISGDEWADIERRKLRGGVSPQVALKMLPWAALDVPEEVLTPLMADSGAMFRFMLRRGRPGFEKLEAAAFWHVPPGVGA